MSETFFGVFTADNGKSTTLQAAGPQKQTSPAVIDAPIEDSAFKKPGS